MTVEVIRRRPWQRGKWERAVEPHPLNSRARGQEKCCLCGKATYFAPDTQRAQAQMCNDCFKPERFKSFARMGGLFTARDGIALVAHDYYGVTEPEGR